MYDEKDPSGRECANETFGLQAEQRSDRERSGQSVPVLTNQCLGKETDVEPPGRGTDKSFPTGQQQVYIRYQSVQWLGESH